MRRKGHLQGALKKAATLHIMFSTKHVSPGFFVRLAACLTENKKYTLFKGGAYRNCNSFCYNEIHRVPYQNQFLMQAFNLIWCKLLNGHHSSNISLIHVLPSEMSSPLYALTSCAGCSQLNLTLPSNAAVPQPMSNILQLSMKRCTNHHMCLAVRLDCARLNLSISFGCKRHPSHCR